MKAEVFVVGFCLVFAGAWFTYAKHTGGLHIKGLHPNEQNIIINSDNFHEQISYSGSIQFNEDETAIAHISPGGYIKYVKNEESMQAKADAKGGIDYAFLVDGRPVVTDSSTRKMIAEAIKEMIAWGFDGEGRMERVFKRGGNAALMEAMDLLKSDWLKKIYAEKIFKTDSLSPAALTGLAKKMTNALGNDYDRAQVLKMYTPKQLQDSAVFDAYIQAVVSLQQDNLQVEAVKKILVMPLAQETFPAVFRIVDQLDNDYEKTNLLTTIIEKGQMDTARADMLLEAITQLGQGIERQNLLTLWINKGSIPADRIDKVLAIVSRLDSDQEKQDMYRKLAAESIHSNGQWVSLIGEVGHINENFQKADLLTAIAQRMPRTDSVKTAYLKVAKTISSDMEYGRAIRAVEQ